jgi:hypothetical protein
LERSREGLASQGTNLAGVSYDSIEVLKAFMAAYKIGFPLLSDKGSGVIKQFGIFNRNIPSDQRAYGIPFPVQYLLAPDGTVREKFFLPDYRTRPTASRILLKSFGVAGGPTAVVETDELRVTIALSSDAAFMGHELGVRASFDLRPGWHIYGEPLPPNYAATRINFDPNLVARQSLDFPKARQMTLASLGESLPVYAGSFEARGTLVLKVPLQAGDVRLGGTLKFQACSEQVCNPPREVSFELPLKIEPVVPPPPR